MLFQTNVLCCNRVLQGVAHKQWSAAAGDGKASMRDMELQFYNGTFAMGRDRDLRVHPSRGKLEMVADGGGHD
jgi:hypothetical protein